MSFERKLLQEVVCHWTFTTNLTDLSSDIIDFYPITFLNFLTNNRHDLLRVKINVSMAVKRQENKYAALWILI